MKILTAKNSGFCFGVKRAVDEAIKLSEKHTNIYTYGQLIHNEEVIGMLEQRGVHATHDIDTILPGSEIIIRSHGVSPEIYDALDGFCVHDMTCPYVKRIHNKVKNSTHEVIIIAGKEHHPEVIGIKGWAANKGYVAKNAKDVSEIPLSGKKSALVVAQTTITEQQLNEVYGAVLEKIPTAELFNSICDTTQKRQEEARQLAKKCDAMIIVGGKNSSNTSKLFDIAREYCKKTYLIQNKSQLSIDILLNCGIIGIVAGASTPVWMIMEVITLMSELENVQVDPVEQAPTEQEPVAEETIVEQAIVEQTTQEQPQAEQTAEEPTADVEPEATADAAPEAAAIEQAQTPAAEPEASEAKEATSAENDFMAEVEKSMVSLRRGQVVKGNVVQVSEDEVCVNVGYKSDGIIKKEDLTADGDVDPTTLFKPGDEIEAEVITLNDGEGNVVLSRKKIESQLKWKNLVENLDTDRIHECKCLKVIKGGVLTKLDGYDAFIPASQLSLRFVEDLNVFVDQVLKVKIIDVDKRQKRFVLSHKEVLQAEKDEKEKELFESIEKGSVIEGTVKRLTDFGAFVDIGGVDGLLHITDISWARIKHPKDALKENDKIEVKVLNIDPEKKKISLGRKQLLPKPWDLAPEKYIVGSDVQGKVVRIASFGAFVELEPTIDGLVHISQIADRRIEKVEDVLTIGQEITARVLEVNSDKKRISLSIRAIIEEEKAAQKALEPEVEEEPSVAVVEEKPERPAPRPPRDRDRNRDRDHGRDRDRDRDDDSKYSRVDLPPVEGATTTLADLFPKLDSQE